MEYRTIGKTDIEVSEFGLGCWALGGPNWEKGTIPSGWSDIEEGPVVDAVSYAVDHGVNHFDNADCYGNGRAERLLARALGSRTSEVVISSKVGWVQGCAEHAYESTNIRHQCEQSLRNLNRDVIDIYYFHHGNFGPDDRYLPEALETMHRLRDEGKIRSIGLSCYTQKEFKRLIPQIVPDAVQCWAHLMDSHFVAKNSILQQLCEEYCATIVGFQPFNQGVLLDKFDPENPPLFGEGDHRINLKKFHQEQLRSSHELLNEVKERYGSSVESLAAVAVKFVLNHASVSGVVAGFRNREQVQENLSMLDKINLNGNDMSFLYKLFR